MSSIAVVIEMYDRRLREQFVGVALAHTARTGHRFNAREFFAFFPDENAHNPLMLDRAWKAYEQLINGQIPTDRAYEGRFR